MATQNLVSVELSEQQKTEIDHSINDLESKLGFTITVLPEDKSELAKAGNTFVPFIEKAHDAISDHPEIMPAVFNINEFKRDYAFRQDLIPINNQIQSLAERVLNTLFAANSDCFVQSLEIYGGVQQNKDKVPGLSTYAADMAEFFKRSKRKAAEVKK